MSRQRLNVSLKITTIGSVNPGPLFSSCRPQIEVNSHFGTSSERHMIREVNETVHVLKLWPMESDNRRLLFRCSAY